MARLLQVTTANLFGALNLILVIFCAYVAARVVHNLRRPELSQAPVAASSGPILQVSSPPRVFAYYQPILDRNLFKSTLVEKTEQKPEEVPDNVEESPLQARLIATVVFGDENKSSATIEDQTARKSEIYHLKDTVMNEAQVVRIERERVIVLRNGVHEALSLYEDQNAAKNAGAAPMGGFAQSIRSGIVAPPGGLRGLAPATTGAPGSANPPGTRIAELNALTKFNSANRDFRVMPHFQAGRIDGLRVFGLSTSSKWSQAGLRNGDVVRSINGQPLAGVQQFYQAVQGSGAGPITVDVQRGPERMTFTYQGES
jgi:type II secretory pathway component PulC